jgi:Flp pilus assembly protein TadG
MSRQTPISKRTTIRQAIRRFLVGDDGIAGAALVEFTLFAPLLIVMSVYTMDFGLSLYNQIAMQNAAQAGAQWAIANHVYNSSDIATAAKNATLSASGVTVSSNEFCGCPSTTGVTQLSTGVCPGGTTCSGLTGTPLAGTYVTVSATVSTTPTDYQIVRYGFFLTSPNANISVTTRIQ